MKNFGKNLLKAIGIFFTVTFCLFFAGVAALSDMAVRLDPAYNEMELLPGDGLAIITLASLQDSDGDGRNDLWDCAPQDPNVWEVKTLIEKKNDSTQTLHILWSFDGEAYDAYLTPPTDMYPTEGKK